MNLIAIAVAVAAGIISYIATRLVLQNAERLGIVAHANERSSHAGVRPTGGGLGIATGSAVAAIPMAAVSPWPALPILICAFAIAAVGYIDDVRSLSPATRLVAQFALFGAAAGCILLAAGATPLALATLAVVTVAGVYWLNIFNFMDGIDGLAASEAAFVLSAGGVLAAMGMPSILGEPVLVWMVSLAAAAVGFLVLNWPPAKIFMGDTGSLHLGFATGILAVLPVSLGWLTVAQWLILGAAFLADATVALVHRVARGENVTQAHRRHAYQFLARRYGHRAVTIGFAAVNVVWLLPLAALAGWMRQWEWLVAAVAYLPLVVAAVWTGAGRPEQS